MEHHFNTEIAKEYGMLEAVIINNFAYWIEKNKANDVNYHDGAYWTYNSMKALSQIFNYATERQIRYAINHLIKAEILQTDNYNQQKYDRTLWYSFTEKGVELLKKYGIDLSSPSDKNVKSILQECQIHLTNLSNGNDKIVKPIPDNKTDNKTDNKKEKERKETQKRFRPPTVEEVESYCRERRAKGKINHVDAEQFCAFYASKNWYVGKNKMTDWKQCVITWEKREEKKRAETQPKAEEPNELDKALQEIYERYDIC